MRHILAFGSARRRLAILLVGAGLGILLGSACQVQITCPNGMYVVRDISGVPTHHCIVPSPGAAPTPRGIAQ